MIRTEIIGLNIVLLTGNIDTNYFDQYYLISKKIYDEKDITSGTFVPGLSKIESEDSILIIYPQSIRFIIKTEDLSKSYECIKRRFKRFVESLPLIPVSAIGMNVVWRITDSDLSLHNLCRHFFFNSGSSIYDMFASDDSMYGAYLSKDYDETTRLKLDMKPIKSYSQNPSDEFLLASFNYHRKLHSDRSKEQILEQLNKWSNIVANSRKIICSLK